MPLGHPFVFSKKKIGLMDVLMMVSLNKAFLIEIYLYLKKIIFIFEIRYSTLFLLQLMWFVWDDETAILVGEYFSPWKCWYLLMK